MRRKMTRRNVIARIDLDPETEMETGGTGKIEIGTATGTEIETVIGGDETGVVAEIAGEGIGVTGAVQGITADPEREIVTPSAHLETTSVTLCLQ
jgi:hypothetical protein